MDPQQILLGKFHGAEKSEEEADNSHYIKSLLGELTCEVRGGRQWDAMDILHSIGQALKGYVHVEQGGMDWTSAA